MGEKTFRKVILFRRGFKKELPEFAKEGEPLYCKDTCELYIGGGPDKPIRKIGIVDPVDMTAIREYYDRWMP